MIGLLIVDDEPHVVERLTATIDWASEGIGQVHGAYSADEALALLQVCSVDIVITDIRMPGMNGLELIAEIKSRWPKTKCILLSGYSDFEYAREAILHETKDYLLKPVKVPELLQSVRRVKAELEEEWNRVLSVRRLQEAMKEHLPLLQAKLLGDLLQGLRPASGQLSEKLKQLELAPFDGCTFALMTVRMEESLTAQYESHLSLMEYAIGNMVTELFGGRFHIWGTKDVHDYLVFAMTPKESLGERESAAGEPPVRELSEEESPVRELSAGEPLPEGAPAAGRDLLRWLERTASQLQAAVSTWLKGTVSVAVSPWGTFPDDVPALHARCFAAFRKWAGYETGVFLRVDADGWSEPHIQPLRQLAEPPTLVHLLDAGRWNEAAAKLDGILAELQERWPESEEHWLEAFFHLASAFLHVAHKNRRLLSDLIGGDYGKLTGVASVRSVRALREWSFRVLERLREDALRESKDSRSLLIRDIKAYIDRHLAQDISLQAIAGHVHMHPVYVSKLFKQETGENLSDYISRVRMAKAEYLLRHTNEKIYEIAQKVGYLQPHSFNQAFRKAFNMTPQEYRNRLNR